MEGMGGRYAERAWGEHCYCLHSNHQDFIKMMYLPTKISLKPVFTPKNSLKWHKFRPLRTNYGSSVGVYRY